jgi:hypothetical protein
MSKKTALYQINISEYFGPDYVDMFNDIARFVCIQVAIQIMLYSINAQQFPFFSSDFFMLLIFIIVGVMAYWLVLRKVVAFK